MSSSAKMNTTKQKVGKELSKKDITYIELCQMYIRECKLNDIADVTINGYNYANEYFLRLHLNLIKHKNNHAKQINV